MKPFLQYLSIRAWTDGIHGTGFKIDKDCTGNVFATGGFIVVHVDSFKLQVGITMIGSGRIHTMFIWDDLPKLCSDLVAALASLKMDNFSHCYFFEKISRWTSVRCLTSQRTVTGAADCSSGASRTFVGCSNRSLCQCWVRAHSLQNRGQRPLSTNVSPGSISRKKIIYYMFWNSLLLNLLFKLLKLNWYNFEISNVGILFH